MTVTFPVSSSTLGLVIVANITTLCPIGTFSPLGVTSPSLPPCTPCPVGRYGDLDGALGCAACPPEAPYSLPGSNSISQCTSCSSGCNADGYGASLCPQDPSWVLWVDAGDVASSGLNPTLSGSCLRFAPTPTQWVQASEDCMESAPGAHLLTPGQVPM